jgi:iron(III) transport system substrate-binding protein
MARTNLIAPEDGFAGDAEAGSGGRRILIGLGLPLLIALDQAKTRRFIARWRDAFEN